MAMSFAVLSSYLKTLYPEVRFIIKDKNCVNKTFPEFWKFMKEAGTKIGIPSMHNSAFSLPATPRKSLILIGDRGCGKSTIGKHFASKLQSSLTDLDQLITNKLQEQGFNSISEYVSRNGWPAFRHL